MSQPPQSTYRLQFHAGFTFKHAAAIVPYLARLGVTHVYASPYLKARKGSTHGYDVIDHCALNPELGTRADYDALCDALARHGMSHILDVVPNHVGVATNDNAWWNDVLANGPDSKYGRYFDIAWEGSPRPELRGKVLLPLLGKLYGEALESGELKLTHDPESSITPFWVTYYDRRFPISPRTLPFGNRQSAIGNDEVDGILRRFNGTPGDARSFDALHELLERQFFRLAYWKNAADEINYRRFFDVNDLAALAMERQEVFDETHKLIFELIREGRITGLRIDHPDGLHDPAEYFERLRRAHPNVYLVVEKILAMDEPLPREWPVHGTSGYDFLNMTNGLFVAAANEQAFTRIYRDWIGEEMSFEDLVYEKKKLILTISLASELHMLAHRLDRLAQRHRGCRDFTLAGLIHGLREVIACFGVYRTYINSAEAGERDARHVERAIAEAIRRNPKTDASVFRFIRDALLQRYPQTFTDHDRAAQLAFAGRFQQLTSPTTAKGVEDTAFYVYNRFVSLNEVGGEPSHFGVSPEQLHAYLDDRRRDWPYAMSTLSTHDTKRSEDVRARLNVLSEIPDEWERLVLHWGELNARHRRDLPTGSAPDRNEEYLIYQTLIGAWPLEPWAADEYDAFRDRVQAYIVKAMREAKVRTSWTAPDEEHEQAVQDFVAALLDETRSGEFLASIRPLRQRVTHLGLVNSLAQTLIKLTAPGVPDTYQGTELWDFSLVDPDNRRPVDYARRRELLDEVTNRWREDCAGLLHDATGNLGDGRLKLHVVQRVLAARREHPGLFTTGKYVPLQARGERRDNVFAFARRHESVTAVVIVPRLVTQIFTHSVHEAAWGDTTIGLPEEVALRNVLTDERVHRPVRVADVLSRCPVALLMSSKD